VPNFRKQDICYRFLLHKLNARIAARTNKAPLIVYIINAQLDIFPLVSAGREDVAELVVGVVVVLGADDVGD